MGSPFEDFKDLYGSTPQAIIDAAHTPGVHAEQLSQLGTDLLQDSKKSDAATIGDLTQISRIPRDAAGHAQKLAAAGQLASGCLLKFGNDGTTFDTRVDQLNSQVLNAAFGQQHDPDVKSGTVKIDVTQIRHDMAVQLRPTYDGYVRDLDHQASAVAGILKAGPDNLDNIKKLIREGFIPLTAASDWPGLTLSSDDKQAYYKSIFSRMSTEAQIAWVNQNKDKLPPEAAAGLSPEVQQHFADQVADAIKADGTVDAETVTLMSFFQGEQAYAHELFSKVTPREFAGEIEDFNNDLFPQNPSDITGPDKDKLALYKSFLTAAGNTLATYSDATGEYAPPGGPSALADQWFKAITDDGHQQDSSALTLMIRAGGQHSTYDAGFLGDLTGKTYEWEIHHDGAVWTPRDTDVTYNPFDPPHVTANGDYSYTWAGGMKATDGLANLLGGMAHSPEAAQNFFLGHYPGSTQDLNHRMDYLVGGGDERTWDGADNSDDGDGLGLALQAATVGQDTRTPDGTAIADKLFENIAKYGGHANGTFTDNWHVGPNMTDSLGTIAAGYSGDLYDMLSNTPPDDGTTHLHISQSELTRVLGEIGGSSDHTGLETLTTAMLLETRNHNIAFLQSLQGPHTLANLTKDPGYLGLQETNGDVMGNLLHYGTDMWSGDDKSDQARAALMSKAIGVAAGFVPGAGTVLGAGASELSKATYDTIKSTALDQIKDAVANSAPSTASTYMDNATGKLPIQLQLNAVTDLYRTGYLGPQDTAHGHYDGVSPNLFTATDPPTVQPGLYDGDGYSLKGSKLPPAQQQAILDAWSDLRKDPSAVWPTIEGATYNGNFYDRVQHPQPMAGG